MRNLFHRFLQWIHSVLNLLLNRIVDVNETNDVMKIVTKEIGLSWVEMENHVDIHNRFFIPYYLEEVKLTYYNDADQNVGYLHFKGPIKIPAYQKRTVVMPAKMSSITGLFNGMRLLISDHIKTRTVGTSRIRFFGMSFELPIDDIMIIDKDIVVTEELDEAEKQRRREIKAENEKQRLIRREESKARKVERRRKFKEKLELEKIQRKAAREKQALKRKARKRLERIKKIRRDREQEQPQETTPGQIKKELPEERATPEISLAKDPDLKTRAESSEPGQDRSYSDPSA